MTTPSIYIPEVVRKVAALYGDLLFEYDHSIRDHLDQMAQVLWRAFQNKNKAACIEINNYHPDYLGKNPEELYKSNLTVVDIQKTIASEYGFKSWEDVEELRHTEINVDFEKAIDHLLNGNLEALKVLISSNPSLLHQTSQYGHQATLLHYAGSNGIEIYRQQVPMNLYQITDFLLQSGIDKEAKMMVYGGAFTVLELLTTSAHPYDAGIAKVMIGLLSA